MERNDWKKSEKAPSVIDSDEASDRDDGDDPFYTSIEWPIFPESWAYVARFLLIQIIIFPHLKLYLTKILLLHDRPPRLIG